ncbi:MAG: hypothetical protein LBE01_00390 [Deltaproteobacteria bacterium]|jgi:hypothetical protein|nr:hypothetical protein [Deltaproteobacteria bacterium]
MAGWKKGEKKTVNRNGSQPSVFQSAMTFGKNLKNPKFAPPTQVFGWSASKAKVLGFFPMLGDYSRGGAACQ